MLPKNKHHIVMMISNLRQKIEQEEEQEEQEELYTHDVRVTFRELFSRGLTCKTLPPPKKKSEMA